LKIVIEVNGKLENELKEACEFTRFQSRANIPDEVIIRQVLLNWLAAVKRDQILFDGQTGFKVSLEDEDRKEKEEGGDIV